MCFALVPMSAVNCPSTASCESDPYVKMRLFDGYSWAAHVLLTLLKLSSSIMLADAPVSIFICTGMLLTNRETVGVLVFAESPRVYRYLSSLLSVKSGCSWVATCQTCDFGLDCHWRGDVALCPEFACFVRHKQNGWVCYICCRFGLWQGRGCLWEAKWAHTCDIVLIWQVLTVLALPALWFSWEFVWVNLVRGCIHCSWELLDSTVLCLTNFNGSGLCE